MKEILKGINAEAEIVETVHKPVYLEEIPTTFRKDLEFIRGKRVYVLSGIARPAGFEKAVEGLGAKVEKCFRFLDHHRYSMEEIAEIMQQGQNGKIDAIITTEKDAVRLPNIGRYDIPIYFLKVIIKIVEGATDFSDCVARICYS